jgi:hypothetical protein
MLYLMDDRADLLRRRIELYRQYLRLGVAVGTAMTYLREIAVAEHELAELLAAAKATPRQHEAAP